MATAAEFTVSAGGTDDLKNFAKAFKPYGDKAKRDLRRVGFSKADTNGSGQSSLAEMENFIKSALESTYKDEATSDRLFKLFRPSYRYAFNNAKNLTTGKASSSEDYVSIAEFRVFTIYLRIYAEMFDIFCHIDGGESRDENDDSRIELDEFMKQKDILSSYNFVSLQSVTGEEGAIELFNKLDKDGSGRLLFSEWSSFLKEDEMNANTNIGVLLSGKLKPTVLSPAKKSKSAVAAPETPRPQSRPSTTIVVSGAYSPGRGASNDLKAYIRAFAPLADKTASGTALRRKEFREADGNGSGQCSLAEIDNFVQDRLKIQHGMVYGADLFDRFRPSIIRAFNNAKNILKGSTDDFITFSEFRMLNAYLCIYAGMYDLFSKIDGGGAGIDENDDRRMTKEEWIEAFPVLKDCGFNVIKKLKDENEAESLFSAMDTNGGGKVLLNEFCDYIKDAEIKERTVLGKLLNFEAPESKKSPSKSPKTSAKTAPEKVVVAASYIPGVTASADLVEFAKIFQPYAEKDMKYKALRQKGFAAADPNGNGHSSLAEVENFITVTLKKSFDANSERPQELFRKFRKSYLYAFNAARSLHASDSKDKDAAEVSDAYLTFPEFRLFNAYLCVYAGMLDGFFAIDGTVDSDTDNKVDRAEFVKSFKAVNGHGFPTMSTMKTDKDARETFTKIDVDGSGKISYREWFNFIATEEIEKNTKVGQLLSPNTTVLAQ